MAVSLKEKEYVPAPLSLEEVGELLINFKQTPSGRLHSQMTLINPNAYVHDVQRAIEKKNISTGTGSGGMTAAAAGVSGVSGISATVTTDGMELADDKYDYGMFGTSDMTMSSQQGSSNSNHHRYFSSVPFLPTPSTAVVVNKDVGIGMGIGVDRVVAAVADSSGYQVVTESDVSLAHVSSSSDTTHEEHEMDDSCCSHESESESTPSLDVCCSSVEYSKKLNTIIESNHTYVSVIDATC